MNLSTEFLKHVLPSEGWYAAFILETKTHIWCRSVEALADHILRVDGAGQTIYHACASFREKSRKAHDVRAVRSFWSDVDAGPGKPYATPQEAAIATYEFCDRVGLPVPTLVGSGAGLHLYWPLVQALEPEVWRRYATALRSLSHASGFHTDPVRTADIASILRTPGTTNRKRDPAVLVEVGPLTGPYELELFQVLENHADDRGTGQRAGEVGSRRAFQGSYASDFNSASLAGGIASVYAAQPRYLQSISEHCKQIERLRSEHGNLVEPLWYAALGVAAYCEDGEALGHEWSSGYSGYSHAETQARLSRTGRFGPTTCQKFHSLEPAICEACPHWGKIKSPIVLSERPEPVQLRSSEDNKTPPPKEQKKQTLDGFGYAKDGKLVALSSTNMGPVETPVADFRLELTAVHNEEIGAESNLSFSHVLPHDGRQNFTLPARVVFGHGASAELAAKGALVYDAGEFSRYLKGMIKLLRDASHDTVQYEQFGWKANYTAFLYGLDLYTCDGVERVSGNKELQIRTKEDWIGPCKRGDLDTWKRTINALFVAGCEPQSFCLLASFGAPLIVLISPDESGAIIHLFTHDAGKGKSVALIGAASVWGRKEGLGASSATEVAKTLTIGALGNLPIINDELHMRDPEVVRKSIMEFTEGRGRLRANRAGELKHTAAGWSTIMMSAANTSLLDILAVRENTADAPSSRVIELSFELPAGLKHQYGEKLKRTLRENSGYAGDAYLRWLVPNIDWVKKTLEKVYDDLWAETNWPPAARFYVKTMAATLVAGMVVEQLGLVDFSFERMRAWMLRNIKYESVAVDTGPWCVSALNRFISAHNNNCLVMPGPFVAGGNVTDLSSRNRAEHLPRGELVMRSEISTQRLFIAVAPLREWLVEQNLSFRELVKKLMKDQVIVDSNKRLTLAAGSGLPGGQERCIEVDLTHEQMTGISNIIPFPKPPAQSSSEEDAAPPGQPT